MFPDPLHKEVKITGIGALSLTAELAHFPAVAPMASTMPFDPESREAAFGRWRLTEMKLLGQARRETAR